MQAQLSGRSWTITKGSEVQTHMGEIYKDPPQSRGEAILRATIDGTEYNDPPQSRVEDLLIELKETIEAGGGGGGVVIDDNTPSTHKVYSSEKVEELIDDKKSVESVDINAANNHLVVTYDDGSTHDAGEITGGGTVSDYPDYAKTEMQSVYSTVRGYISTLDNPIIVGFNTDQHIIANATSSGSVATRNEVTYGLKTLRDLTKVLPFNLVVLGGDTHGSSSGTIASMQNSALYVVSQMYGTNAPLASLTGNHEGGQDNQTITREQVLKSHMTFSMQNKTITLVDEISGYFDDPTCKVRFIFLDAFGRTQVSYTSAQYNAVLNTMLSGVPSGYKAIIFSHHPLDENLPQAAERKGWNNPASCHSTLQAHKDKIIACFCGHVHNNLQVEDLDGVTFVATTCAGQYELNDGSTRTNGTAGATAYDVFVIDQTAKKIYAVRYGNGNDREISFAHEQPVVPRGNILENIGWTDGKRLNSSGALVDASGYSTTDLILDVNSGDTLYFADGTLPISTNTWQLYNDDGTLNRSMPAISTSQYGATYAAANMYLGGFTAADEKSISYNYYGVFKSKNPEDNTYGPNRFIFGEAQFWESGYLKSFKLAYDSGHYQNIAKIRFTFPTAKKDALDIRVNEPFDET